MSRQTSRNQQRQKTFVRCGLVATDEEIRQRTKLVNHLSEQFSSIPETNFCTDGEFVRISQRRIDKRPWPKPNDSETKEAFLRLADELDRISPRIVHGDLSKKNLLFDGKSFCIIDWEPCLRQKRKGRVTLLYTEPYLALEDRRNDRLSQTTDKLTYLFSAYRGLHGHFPFSNGRKLVLDRINKEVPLVPMSEAELSSMSFVELTGFAFRKKNSILKQLLRYRF